MIAQARSTPARPRGRPRDDSVDRRVLAATVDELAEKGIAEFSVTSVAARAKAAKRSIQVRWPRREDLILAGMSTLAAGLSPPRTGSISEDLRILLDEVAAVYVEPRRGILQRCAAEMERFPDLYEAFRRDSVDRCMAAIEDAVHDAIGRGEVRESVNPATVAEAVTGFALMRASLGLEHVLPAGLRTDLATLLLNGIRAPTQGTGAPRATRE
ncbi:TetR-like C-terminal domain-containing protein [Streptomyces sp. NPDC096311]|uniref:TetR-like C-terminal domain-containing protein n=1 Tax=Streptomyces sp. NPDC096311 TaxID=3366083 RepID=UPI0038145E32